jgi:hypothetical protein
VKNLTTARDLLDLIAEFVNARDGEDAAEELQSIAQRFDVALGSYIVEYASMQNEA